MSERYESAADRAIREAMERGDFDNLPGAGKPIPGLGGRHDPDWWLKGFLEREKVSMPLPPSLQLRKDIAELPDQLADVAREQDARAIIEALNERIRRHQRIPDGPPIHINLVDSDAALEQWRVRRRG